MFIVDPDAIFAIENRWNSPHEIPGKELFYLANNDIHYLLMSITELNRQIAELKFYNRKRILHRYEKD